MGLTLCDRRLPEDVEGLKYMFWVSVSAVYIKLSVLGVTKVGGSGTTVTILLPIGEGVLRDLCLLPVSTQPKQ